MGQNGSHSGPCCTSREGTKGKGIEGIDDESRSDKPTDKCCGAGGCLGGSGDTPRKPQSGSPQKHVDPFCHIACITKDQGGGTCINRIGDNDEPKMGVFGEITLRPKLHKLRRLEDELDSLSQLHRKVSEASTNEAAMSELRNQIKEANFGSRGTSEWVHFMLQRDPVLSFAPPRLLSEACSDVFSGVPAANSSSPVLLESPKVVAKYAFLLSRVNALAEKRMEVVRNEMEILDQQISEAEDFIDRCYEKLDEDGSGEVTKHRFVNFLCDEHEVENRGGVISRNDAASLFDNMTRGEQHLSYERFQEEASQECLEALELKIGQRRRSRQRFRDWVL